MIIESISLKNFKSYYDKIDFNFSKGLNIISGHEGSGKSNLFDGFMWLLFNRISDYSWGDNLEDDNINFVNDKIKNEIFTNASNQEIKCEVIIKLKLPKSNIHPYERNYTIKREKIIRLKEKKYSDSFFDSNNWACDRSNLVVSWKDEKYNEKEEINENAETELDAIFPEKIRKYIWFQGEQLNELLDFENEHTLRKAIDYISYLSAYENMKDIVDKIHDLLDKKYKNKLKTRNRDSDKFEKLNNKSNYHKTKKLEAEADFDKYKTEISDLNKRLKEEKNKLVVLAGMPELQKEEAELNAKVDSLKENISTINDKMKESFVKKWMLNGTSDLLSTAEIELQKFVDFRQKLITQNSKQLAEGTPGDSLINKMLKEQHCIICDREASKGSPEFLSIESHLDKNKKIKNIVDPKIENLNTKIINLKQYPTIINNTIKNINEDIISQKNTIQTILDERNYSNKKLNNIKDKIKNIVTEKGESIKNLNAKNISATINRLEEDIKTKGYSLEISKDDITHHDDLMRENSNALKNLKDPDLGDFIEEKLLNYTEFISEAIKQQTEEQRIELINKIEETANSIQSNIANINNIVIVYVKIDKNDYTLKFIDADGNPNPGHGAQNTLAKMSIINAIIQISNEMKGISFPFIADAPTSDFGNEFTHRFFESISNTYEQSIIMTKDIAHNVKEFENLNFVNSLIEIKKNSSENISTSTNSNTITF